MGKSDRDDRIGFVLYFVVGDRSVVIFEREEECVGPICNCSHYILSNIGHRIPSFITYQSITYGSVYFNR